MNIEEQFIKKINHALKEWKFEEACSYHEELLQYSFKHISEYIKLLADFGKLDQIFSLCNRYDFELLKEQAKNPQQKYPDVISYCLEFTKDKYIPSLCGSSVFDKNSTLLTLSSKKEKTELLIYLEKNSEIIINNNSSAFDNMILNFAINNLLSEKMLGTELGIKIASVYTENKNINGFRKRFVLSSILNYFYSNEDQRFFKLKEQWYSHLQRIATQLNSYFNEDGAKIIYSKFNNAILNANNVSLKIDEKNNPRVAVCISGMFRGNAAAIKTIQENIISPLNADVFIHSWDRWQPWAGIGGAGPHNWVWRLFGDAITKICPRELKSFIEFKKYFPRAAEIIETPVYQPFTTELILSFIQPTSFMLDNESEFIASLGEHAESFIARGSYNQAKMFYGIYEATQLMLKYENEHNFKYDYVVKIRPDCAVTGELSQDFLKKLNFNDLATRMEWVVGPSDTLNVARRDVHVNISNIWAASLIAKQLAPFESFPKYDAHSLLFLWMVKNNIMPIKLPLETTLTLVSLTSFLTEKLHDALAYDLQHTAKKIGQDENAKKFIGFLLGESE